jgi:uncharacterized protein (TIGR03000 family)
VVIEGHAAPAMPGAVVPGTIIEKGEKVIEKPKEVEKKKEEKKKEIEKKKGVEDETLSLNAAPATIIVNVPADAQLKVDGVATTSTSARRVFVSPALENGKQFTYTLQAEFSVEGKPVVLSKDVRIQAGATVEVSLSSDDLAVASR